MCKLIPVMLSCLLLAGCNTAVENVTETSFSEKSETVTETSFAEIVSETELSEETTVKTEVNEEIPDTTTVVEETDIEEFV